MRKSIASAVIVLVIAGPISAHRLNEYLQATILSVDKGRLQLSMRLVPGTAVSATVLQNIDTNQAAFFRPPNSALTRIAYSVIYR